MNKIARTWFHDTLRSITALLNADEHSATLMTVVAYLMFLATGFILNLSWGHEILLQEMLSKPIAVETEDTDVAAIPRKYVGLAQPDQGAE